MQIEHLRYLMAAAQYASLNKAAKALYCTQPAITRAIKTVEKELGAPVFERTPTGIVPTQLGAKVLEDSRLIFGYIDNWRRSAEEAQSKSSISILFTGVSPRFITVNTIVNFQKAHPDVHVNAQYLPYTYARSALEPEEFSRLIISYKVPNHLESAKKFAVEHGMQLAILQRDEFCLFASAQNSVIQQETLTFQDLRGRLFFLPQDPYRFPYLDLLNKWGCVIGPQMWQDENLMLALTLDHTAFSLRPSCMSEHNYYFENGLLQKRNISDLALPVNLCLFYPSADRISGNEAAFVRSIRETFPEFQIL